jgi:hypothetical protein
MNLFRIKLIHSIITLSNKIIVLCIILNPFQICIKNRIFNKIKKYHVHENKKQIDN